MYKPMTEYGKAAKRTAKAEGKVAKGKRFIRYREGAELYSMGLNKFQQLAKEAGAVYKIDKLVLVNMDILDRYLETFRLEGEF